MAGYGPPADPVQPFRYVPPTPETTDQHIETRALYVALAEHIVEALPAGRHRSLALTELQASMLWAHAAIAVDTPREVG